MTCQHCQELIVTRSRDLPRTVHRHMADCPACRDFARAQAALLGAGGAGVAAPSPELDAAILRLAAGRLAARPSAAMAPGVRRASAAAWRAGARPAWALAWAALAVLALAVAFLVRDRSARPPVLAAGLPPDAVAAVAPWHDMEIDVDLLALDAFIDVADALAMTDIGDANASTARLGDWLWDLEVDMALEVLIP